MRVIAGSARSLKLVTIDSMDTRPTTDRIKETLFNMLSNDIPGCRFLDVFSGSGAIGIGSYISSSYKAPIIHWNRGAQPWGSHGGICREQQKSSGVYQ